MTPLPPESAALSGQLNTALLQRWEKSAVSKLQTDGLQREIRREVCNSQAGSKRRSHRELWVVTEKHTSRKRRSKVKCWQCRSSGCPGWTREMKRIRWAKMSTTEWGEKASRSWGMLREPWEDGLMLDRPQTDPLLPFSSESFKINAEKAIISTYTF